MKKGLLLLSAVCLAITGVFAQHIGPKPLTKTKISSSWNHFTSQLSTSTCLSANSDLNTIVFSHRANSTTPNGSSKIQITFSKNGGITWDSTYVTLDSTTLGGRFPSGVIFNPKGNTNPDNAYSVNVYPLMGTSSYVGNYFSSHKLDKSSKSEEFLMYEDTVGGAEPYIRMSTDMLTVTDSGTVYIVGDKNKDNGIRNISTGYIITKGVWNKNTNCFDWSHINMPSPCRILYPYIEDHGLGATAWSADGQTGYFAVVGVDSITSYPSYQPIVYKSIDGGDNWTKMTVQDYSLIPAINNTLVKYHAGKNYPYFAYISDAVVDANNQLHLVAKVRTAASATNIDSARYYASSNQDTFEGFLFDVYTTGDDTWNAHLIDTLWGDNIDATNQAVVQKAYIPYDERLQISMSDDRKHIFYYWMDTQPDFGEYNLYPNLEGRSYNVETQTLGATTNYTLLTDFETDIHYLYVADKSLQRTYNNKTYYETPIVVSKSEIGKINTDPLYHYYLDGIVPDYELGIKENEKSTLNTKIFPNPAEYNVNIEFSSVEKQNITLSVYNSYGQLVKSSKVNLNAGINTINYNISDLTTGIYFCKFETLKSSITQKLIVK